MNKLSTNKYSKNKSNISGQSFKRSMIVNYNSRFIGITIGNFTFSAKLGNTHLHCNGKYYWMADFLFYLLCFCELGTDLPAGSNPNQSKRRSGVQWCFPLQSKWVFYDPSNNTLMIKIKLYLIFRYSPKMLMMTYFEI